MLLGTEDDLGEAFAVAKIDEDDAAVVTAGIDPAGEGDGLADVAFAKLIAEVRAVHGGNFFCRDEQD
jgi:poly-gamma-glutamate capsule biosynthesis protein CapA/YwtB (metallophosphatase superfamily)